MLEAIILLVILLLMLGAVYIFSNRDYMTASFFAIGTFIVSTMVVILNIREWQMNLSITTVFILCTMLSTFCIGDLVGSLKRIEISGTNKNKKVDYVDSILPSKRLTLLFSVIMIAVAYFYFQYIFRMSLLWGNRFGISKMFQYARYAINDENVDTSMGTLLSHSLVASKALGYIYLFIVIFNLINRHKNNIVYYVPCFLYIIHIALSTARLDFITYMCAGIIYYVIISIHINSSNKRFKMKTILFFFAGIFIVFLGFRILGYLTGKSSVRELWWDISIYSGSSIPAFDYYLTNPQKPNDIFGKETLYNIYKMARSVGITSVKPYNVALPFIDESNFSTNIYTAFRRLIQDYGFVFSYIILFLEGLFYGVWTKRQKTNGFIGVGTVIFAYMFYPVVYMFIEEKFILNFTAIGLVYQIIYFYIFYKVLVGNRIISSKRIL